MTLWFPEDKEHLESAGYGLNWKRGIENKTLIIATLRDYKGEWRIDSVRALDLTWVERSK